MYITNEIIIAVNITSSANTVLHVAALESFILEDGALESNFSNNNLCIVKPIFIVELIKIHVLFANATFPLTSVSRTLLSLCDSHVRAKIFKFSERKKVSYVHFFLFPPAMSIRRVPD